MDEDRLYDDETTDPTTDAPATDDPMAESTDPEPTTTSTDGFGERIGDDEGDEPIEGSDMPSGDMPANMPEADLDDESDDSDL